MTNQEMLAVLDELEETLACAFRSFDEGNTGFLNLAGMGMKIENARCKLEKENENGLQQHEE